MGFKRKRSADESPVSVSSFGLTPEAQSPAPTMNAYSTMAIDAPVSRGTGWDFLNLGRVKSSDWGMRTRKRFRDNRPDECVIHESTISKLFSAQRKQPHAEPIPSDMISQPAPAVQKPQKSTLHAFWNIAAAPAQPSAPSMPLQHNANAPRCEDCDAPLEKDANDMDIDMDVDRPLEESSFACRDCGRNVCGTCAVVADARHCLQCATSARNQCRRRF